MGSEKEWDREKPVHIVEITKPTILIYAAEIAKLTHWSDQLSQPMQNALVEIVPLIQQEI
ncbi:MAG: hypothetical protein ABFS56_11695 [Pseudomonadota bacterium]